LVRHLASPFDENANEKPGIKMILVRMCKKNMVNGGRVSSIVFRQERKLRRKVYLLIELHSKARATVQVMAAEAFTPPTVVTSTPKRRIMPCPLPNN